MSHEHCVLKKIINPTLEFTASKFAKRMKVLRVFGTITIPLKLTGRNFFDKRYATCVLQICYAWFVCLLCYLPPKKETSYLHVHVFCLYHSATLYGICIYILYTLNPPYNYWICTVYIKYTFISLHHITKMQILPKNNEKVEKPYQALHWATWWLACCYWNDLATWEQCGCFQTKDVKFQFLEPWKLLRFYLLKGWKTLFCCCVFPDCLEKLRLWKLHLDDELLPTLAADPTR